MSCWDAQQIEIAASEGRQVAPTYTNITDSRVDLPTPDSSDHLNSPSPHIFLLNNAGKNRLAFACLDPHSLHSWVTAIRLASWERSRLFEIYTGTLLGLRFCNSFDSPPPNEKTEGYLSIRLPRDTEWTKVWCSLVRDKSSISTNGSGSQNHLKDNKWNRRGSLFNLAGFVAKNHPSPSSPGSGCDSEGDPALVFYPKKGSKKHLGLLTDIKFAAAVYPESKALVDSSTMFKLEGRFEGLVNEARISESKSHLDLEGFILATPDEGTEYDMLGWLVGIMSAFGLYGRPQGFNYDPADPHSFYFAYPVGAERERLFLDCHLAAESLDAQESSLAQLRRKFSSLVASRLQMIGKSAVESPERVHHLPESTSIISPSIDHPHQDLVRDHSSSLGKVHHHSSTPGSPARSTSHPLPDSGSSAKSTNSLSSSDPSLSSETHGDTCLVPSSHQTSPDCSRSLLDLKPSDSVKIGRPSTPTIAFEDELQSYASLVTYPSEDSQDRKAAETSSPMADSSLHRDPSSTKSQSESPNPTPGKAVQPSSNPQNSSMTSNSAPAITLAQDSEGFEDVIYALSLADDSGPLAQTPASGSVEPASPVQPASPKSPTPQPNFLSKPPPSDSLPPQGSSRSVDLGSETPKTSFPSSFAAGKKSAARLAAAQAAQAAEKAASHRPGRPGKGVPAAKKKTPTSWNSDSDDDEDEDNPIGEDEDDEDDDEEDEEDERLKRHRLNKPISPSGPQGFDRGFSSGQERHDMHQLQAAREGTYSMYSTSGFAPQDGRSTPYMMQPTEMGQFPNPAVRREMPAVLRDQPAEVPENNAHLRPAFSQHGLLHRVMQERQEKSARSMQEAAHWTGEPLVQVNHKPSPIQSGLLGAIASHERDRKRDGGMGAVLTERARERAIKQRETDEIQRQSMYNLMALGGGAGPTVGFGTGYPSGMISPAMVPMMYNPQMMAAAAGQVVPNPAAYEQMLFQQQMQLQQQAMMNTQQCYISPYGYSNPAATTPGGMGLGAGNLGMMNGTGSGLLSSHQSMYGFPTQSIAGMAGFQPSPSAALVNNNVLMGNNSNNPHHPHPQPYLNGLNLSPNLQQQFHTSQSRHSSGHPS